MRISFFHLLCIMQGVCIFLGYAEPAEADGIAAITWIPFIVSFSLVFLIGVVIRKEKMENEPETNPEVIFFVLAGTIALVGMWMLGDTVIAPNAQAMELSFRRSIASTAVAALMYVVSYISVIKQTSGKRPWSVGGLFAIRILSMLAFAAGVLGFAVGPDSFGLVGICTLVFCCILLIAIVTVFVARFVLLGQAKSQMHVT